MVIYSLLKPLTEDSEREYLCLVKIVGIIGQGPNYASLGLARLFGGFEPVRVFGVFVG